MRREYVKPVMESEEFVANEYVASCTTHYVLTCSGTDGMDGCGAKETFTATQFSKLDGKIYRCARDEAGGYSARSNSYEYYFDMNLGDKSPCWNDFLWYEEVEFEVMGSDIDSWTPSGFNAFTPMTTPVHGGQISLNVS